MTVKEIADKLFGANPAPKEISLEEMLRYRAKSKEMLQNRIKSGKRKSNVGKEKVNTIGAVSPCPKCGVTNWNVFPDGRGYCLECGAVKELDGTVTGGAMEKIVQNKRDDKMVNGEVKCEKCGKIQPFSDTEEKLMEFIKQPHKDCGGKISFSIVEETSKGIESKSGTGATIKIIEREKVPEKKEQCDNPKLDKFVCNNCRDSYGCSQTDINAVICLLISIDMKLKKLVERGLH